MRLFKLSLVICVIIFLGSSLFTNSFAQEEKTVKITAKQVDKTQSENPNISFQAPNNDDNPEPQPKGAFCDIKFENWTGYYVDIYVNSYYKGTVYPWGNYIVSDYAGFTTVYCITTGGTYEWYSDGSCDYYFIYELHAD